MHNPIDFYKQQQTNLTQESSKLKKKLINFGVLRFIVFIGTSFLIYLTFNTYPDVLIIATLGVLLFTYLVFQYINIKKEKAIVDQKIAINTTEINVLQRNFQYLETGNAFVNPAHFYSNDIDLFGKGSFFQYTNRTATVDGKVALSKLLIANETKQITAKQQVVEELSKKVKWRQHFTALARLVTTKSTSSFIVDWVLNYTTVLPTFMQKIQVVFSIISLVLIGLFSFDYISFSYLIIWFFIGVFTTGFFLKKTSTLYAETDKIRETFKQYHVLLNEIENQKFESEILIEKQQIIRSEQQKASLIFKRFSKILDAFDNRNNIVIAVLGNGLFLWEITNASKVEKWLVNYKHTVKEWFAVVAYFDAQNSLANFKFNHPTFVFPEILSTTKIIKATNLGHPLLDINKRVDNDFFIKDEQFFIVTGANMAGKSTFLRTVSLAVVMANCGLPVCAERFLYNPIKLITSMRSTDSLIEDKSYFYSELKRLKFIVDAIKTEKYFIILDEILKGTNSKDKATGSKRFIEKLTKSKSTGIIATHDVSLCELENEFSTIKNYYFDAEINNNELHFDYTFKKGICKNMNASFLLEKMEIV